MGNRRNPFSKFLTKEQIIHKDICHWLSLDARTKDLLWWHTINEGKRTPFERYLFSIMGGKKGVSDFIMPEPVGQYNGLVVEIKPTFAADKKRIFKKNGECYYPEQYDFLLKMREKGRYATFSRGYDETKQIFLEYLAGKSQIPYRYQ